ncbi:MAG: chloride channel protein [Lachnospiraceae bacterium]|nr:chloride channel protein [Lachnospiraceae bacterium]
MEVLVRGIKRIGLHINTFIGLVLVAAGIGTLGGLIGTAFHVSVDMAAKTRTENEWIIWLLPIGGILISIIYRLMKTCGKGTNCIIDSIQSGEEIPVLLAPAMFLSTFITHLFGGSAGREGAALQIGGSMGYGIGKFLKLDEKGIRMMTLCGMASIFSALFGTPLGAAFFTLEVANVGYFYYSYLVPCVSASLVAYWIALSLGVTPTRFLITSEINLSPILVLKVVAIGAVAAAVSIIFCLSMHWGEYYFKRFIKNQELRIATGGIIIIALTYLVGSYDYNGAGMAFISSAMIGPVFPLAFLIKIIFTAITVGSGYKGGEVLPSFFIGATLGSFLSSFLGVPTDIAASLGLIAVFCGAVNCPIASIVLAIELFGTSEILLFGIVCTTSYMLSGNYKLYSSQKIID